MNLIFFKDFCWLLPISPTQLTTFLENSSQPTQLKDNFISKSDFVDII